MSQQRNKPCPCGSNLKYKKCCGSPEALARAIRQAATTQSPDCNCQVTIDPTQFEIDACQRILADTARRSENPRERPIHVFDSAQNRTVRSYTPQPFNDLTFHRMTGSFLGIPHPAS